MDNAQEEDEEEEDEEQLHHASQREVSSEMLNLEEVPSSFLGRGHGAPTLS